MNSEVNGQDRVFTQLKCNQLREKEKGITNNR